MFSVVYGEPKKIMHSNFHILVGFLISKFLNFKNNLKKLGCSIDKKQV